MMKFIFEKKPYLLKNNNVDQIILCCIMSCLSINEKEEHQTLEILFFEYNSKIQFSYNSNQLNLTAILKSIFAKNWIAARTKFGVRLWRVWIKVSRQCILKQLATSVVQF